MHRLLTTLRRGFKERIGWKRLGIAASLLIIAFAIATLVRTLKGVDVGVILVALLLEYEHSLVSPNSLSKLDAAFFTMNGVISVVFFIFIAGDLLLKR